MGRVSRVGTGVIGLGVLGLHHLHRPLARAVVGAPTERIAAAPGRASSALEGVARELVEFDVISFDLLDTLITRTLRSPADVHDVVALRAEGEGIDVPRWRGMREQAEAQARRAKGLLDVTADDIYGELRALLPAEVAARLLELEVEVEVDSMVPTTRGRLLFERAQSAGKTIVIASDMYLPKSVLERCLEKCGYAGWELLIASGDDGVSKYEGSTFRLLQKRYGGRIVHIGDNRAHDVRNARRSGIRAIHLPAPAVHRARERRYSFSERSTSADLRERVAESLSAGLSALQLEQRAERWNAFAEAGYAVLGPILLGYTSGLHRVARDRGATRLHFLAREGRILRRAYEAVVPRDEQLPSTYALLSSRVTSMAALGPEPTTEALRFVFKTPVHLTARAYLSRFLGRSSGVDVDQVLRDCGVPPEKRMDEREALVVLLPAVKAVWPELHRVALEQRRLLQRYLSSIALDDPAERPLLVDVGWAGTIQRALENVLGLELEGYYMCLVDDVRTRSTARLNGWIDARRGGSDTSDARDALEGLRVLEVLMAAPDEGSVGSFVEPAPGQRSPGVTRLGLEFPPAARRLIDECQDEAVRFLDDFRNGWAALRLTEGEPVGAPGRAALVRLLARPTRRQLDDFARLPFDGSYGERPGVVGPWGASAFVVNKLAPTRIRRGVRTRILQRFQA